MRQAHAASDGIHLTLHDQNGGRASSVRYDAVVLATGYERERHKTVLASLAGHLGDFTTDRDYRLRSSADFHPAIFVQGASEPTHGISDSLLSLTAVRTGEIGNSLLAAMEPLRQRMAVNSI